VRRRRVLGLAAVLTLLPVASWGWLAEGHRQVAADAVRALPREVPGFFRSGALAVGHSAVDPDVWKLRATAELRDSESPEHYLDWEVLHGRELPALRSEYAALLSELELSSSGAGLLPYSLLDWWQRLQVAFAEHRRWPRNRHVRRKVTLYAGVLAHYAADACQPLHTTIHHDGRALPDGTSPHTGIHHVVDGLFENAPFDRGSALFDLTVEPFPDVRTAVREQLDESFGLVDRLYELGLDAEGAGGAAASPEVTSFARERYRITARFLARLFLTAWVESAGLEIPDWVPHDGSR
jgi:hypothetical protein